MSRIEATVTVSCVYKTTRPSYASAWRVDDFYIYTFTTEDGTVYVWKTTTFAGLEVEDPKEGWIIKNDKRYRFDAIGKGDIITIRATVKGQSEYKGQPQTEVSRVKILSRSLRGKTWEELQTEREEERKRQKQEQLDSVNWDAGDFIWKSMPYKQYKEHYSDCETIIDSFDVTQGRSYVDIIVRANRLKPSGTRGRHYSGYQYMWTEDGEKYSQTYYAISEETALRRLRKEHPDAEDVKAGKIFRYN